MCRESWKYGVGGGLPAQMSEEMRRSAQRGCHTKRISMDACTHVGRRRRGEYERGGHRFFAVTQNDRMGARNDRRVFWETERGHVRVEDATQGVSQGLVAQMSGEMLRSAWGGCHTKRISMVACTHVGRRRRGENRFFAGAQNDGMGFRMTGERTQILRWRSE